MSETTDALDLLVTNTTQMLATVAEVKETFEDSKGTAVAAADTATTQAGIATTKANEAVATASLAEGHKDSAANSALAAAAAAAGIGDVAARVMPILKERGITNIKAIAFKGAEGWEKQGNQSYKSEARPAGRWLGEYANATAAWSDPELDPTPIAGDVYWQTTGTVGLYKCTTTNNSERVYRYGSDHLPLEAMFVASGSGTTARLFVFDLTDPNMPLWMEFTAGVNKTLWAFTTVSPVNLALSGLAWEHGKLVSSRNGSNGNGVVFVNFILDEATVYINTRAVFSSGIADRNNQLGYKVVVNSQEISSGLVNSIAAYNGYTSAATNSGVSVIKPDGTVVSSNLTTSPVTSISVLNGRLYFVRDHTPDDQIFDCGLIENLADSFPSSTLYSKTTLPFLSASTLTALSDAGDSLIVPSVSAVDQLWPDPADSESSLIARHGLNYATPPMKKPELMLICGTDEGTVGATDYVGDFSADTDGFLSRNASTSVSAVGSKLRLTFVSTGGSQYSTAELEIPCVQGALYRIKATVENVSGVTAPSRRIAFRSTSDDDLSSRDETLLSDGSFDYYRVADSSTMYLRVGLQDSGSDSVFDWSGISVEEVITDYSGKSNNATINGTLTATAEITGGVAGLSGFSASDYIEVPYQSELDVGTGDFRYSFAFKTNATSLGTSLLRSDPGGLGNRIALLHASSGKLALYMNGYGVIEETASAYNDNLLHTLLLYRYDGTIYMEIDGDLVKRVVTSGNVTNNTAIIRIGVNASNNNPFDGTIWFAEASAVAPTAEEAALMHKHMRNLIEGKANLDEIPTSAAYDPIRQAVELVGDTYRQTLQDGAITSSVEHGQGSGAVVAVGPRSEIGVGGSTSVEVSVPERNLREKTLTLVPERKTVTYEGDATGSRVLFPDPTNDAEVAEVVGWRPVLVYDDGVEQTKGAADDYTIADYGLGRYCVEFATEPADGNNVDIVFEREVWK